MDYRNVAPGDIDAMIELNRATPSVAQHSKYLFQLCATLYWQRCFVAYTGSRLAGYSLGIPGPDSQTEFLLQVVVDESQLGKFVGANLMKSHCAWVKTQPGVTRIWTSVRVGYRNGLALIKQAGRNGLCYNDVAWPNEGHLDEEERLIEARLFSVY